MRARRRVPLPVLAVAACLGLTVGVTVALAAVQRPADAQSDLEAEGRELYRTGCISCHGTDGAGVKGPEGDVRGPSILEAGEAGAYYQLSTGRMPLANSSDDPVRKPPAYSPTEIEALVAYVASLGDGPPLPVRRPRRRRRGGGRRAVPGQLPGLPLGVGQRWRAQLRTRRRRPSTRRHPSRSPPRSAPDRARCRCSAPPRSTSASSTS